MYYNHGNSELTVTNPNNTGNAKYLASLDAVLDGGTIRCWVTTQPQFAALYPGCVPTNITDPAGPSAAAYDYLRTETAWTLTQELDDVGFSIGGGLWGFGLPAGEITANLSGEARWATYVMESNALPTDFVNCTGLRMCLQGGGAPVRWVQNTNAEVDAEQHVYEGALEFNVPLLKDVPGFQELSTNLAGRWTKYSEFDAVESWKIGLNWRVNETLRFRSTLSSDIRAPNLNDLFQPAGVSSTGFRDLLTGVTSNTRLISRGNADLTPEEAKTVTAGFVLTPSAIPRFSVSVDFYETKLTNAITQISYQNDAIQGLCVGSAPATIRRSAAGDSADHGSVEPRLHTCRQLPERNPQLAFQRGGAEDQGLRFRAQLQLGHVGWPILLPSPGDLSADELHAQHAGFALVHLGCPARPAAEHVHHVREQRLERVAAESLAEQRHPGDQQQQSQRRPEWRHRGTQNYVDETLDAYDVVDVTVGKKFEFGGSTVEAFLTVNNLLDERAPLYPSNSGLPGLFYPTLGFYDDMGRFYTAGVRMTF